MRGVGTLVGISVCLLATVPAFNTRPAHGQEIHIDVPVVQIAALMRDGVEVEEWRRSNADLLPDVKVVTGANYRIVQLVPEGFVQLQP